MNSRSFIDIISKELSEGQGFVPFIGAGMSVPSGAPLVLELHQYLHACIFLALGVDEPGKRPWNPRTDQWPPFSLGSRFTKEKWLEKIQQEFHNRNWDEGRKVFQEAVGALADWRGALVFLSRIVCEVRGKDVDERYLLALDAPNAEVIENGIRRVTGGRLPTLGHRMLATLATLLRLDVILTTNFDDLLEKAFAEARNPLSVFEVHMSSSLPPWSAFSERRSLVKMHGNLYSLRLDYTLDALPVEADRWRFLEYLLSSDGRSELARRLSAGQPPPEDLPYLNHLLIMGVSASERRTRAFIEHACRHLREGFKVFWLCYTKEDLAAVQDFEREIERVRHGVRRFEILRHPDYGLLFAELYQTIRRGIPTSGIIFPSAARLSIPPIPRRGSSKKGEEYAQEIRERLAKIQTEGYQHSRLIVATSRRPNSNASAGGETAPTGISSMCARVFEEIRERQVAVWLDMNDVSSTDDLFEQLLDAVSYRNGQPHPLPVFVRKQPEAQADEIHKLIEPTNKQWVFFLNARETPGTNLIDERDESGIVPPPNDWLDGPSSPGEAETQVTPDDFSKSPEHFLRFLLTLCAPGSSSASVVLMCRQENNGADSRLVERIVREKLESTIVPLKGDCSDFDERETVSRALEWTEKVQEGETVEDRRWFLQALISLQRVRYLATIWSDCCRRPTSAATASWPKQGDDRYPDWVDELEEKGLVRRKPGGFIWIHSRARTLLRRRLFNSNSASDEVLPAGWDPQKDAPEIHWRLAQWYRRILAASWAPGAVFEAVYHACRSAEEFLRVSGDSSAREAGTAVDRVNWASSLLHTHAFLIQTQGYSRGSCRRLADIRDRRCRRIDEASRERVSRTGDVTNQQTRNIEAATRLLRFRCTDVMRAIAREVGEDRLAYVRQNDVRSLLSGFNLDSDSRTRHLKAKGDATRDFLDEIARIEEEAAKTPNYGEYWLEWLRWWRWNGMLGIASRSYHAARRSLLRATLSVTIHARSQKTAVLHEAWEVIGGLVEELAPRENLRQPPASKSSEPRVTSALGLLADVCDGEARVLGGLVAEQQGLRVELARLLEQIVSLEMQEAGLLDRCTNLQDSGKQDSEADETLQGRYCRVRDWIRIGKRVVESIRSNDKSSDSHDSVRALWCQSRLLTHEGLCAARINPRESAKEAMVLLADSEAALHLHDPRRSQVDLAIIELHRAEVRLVQANAIEIPLFDDPSVLFRNLGKRLYEVKYFGANAWRAKSLELERRLRDVAEGTDENRLRVDRHFRTAKALVQDGLTFLDRADRIFSARRRNVGWMTWYFQRKLTAIGMSIWAAILEKHTPIPFLGLETAPRGCATTADRLLEDAQRMIRIDAYRLATIVEAYIECTKAFVMRLYLEQPRDMLSDRQARMVRLLEVAAVRLESVLSDRLKNNMGQSAGIWAQAINAARTDSGPMGDEQQQKNDLDPRAVQYVKNIIDEARRVVVDLERPLI